MQIRSLVTGAILLIIFGISSCRDDFDFEQASDELGFSSDTISLDTIFNHTNSQTYKFTVHNRQNEDVEIPRIYLGRGEGSFYKLNVDGMSGYAFENVAVRAKDSIFVFVEIAAGDAPVNPFYEDEVNFETTNGSQQVKLLSWIERAMFYNTEMTENFSLGNVDWNSDYSRVIYGNVTAENFNATAGTKVYFHNNSSLTVNGTMNVVGNKGNEVRFRSDRHDERSDSLPNMWGKVKIKSSNNSALNKIDYAIIKGGNIGLEVENSRLEISNTKILNNESIGLYTIKSNVTGKNLVVNNSNIAALGIEGGSSKFINCTFGNYHNIGQGAGQNYSLYLSNTTGENNESAPVDNAIFYNSIFFGRNSNSIHVDSGISLNDFRNNFIRNGNSELNFPASNVVNNDYNLSIFVNPTFGTNDLRLKAESPALGIGSFEFISGDAILLNDINLVPRGSQPNPGAYEGFITE